MERTALDVYADAVVRDRIPAGKYHRLACVRHQQDRRREDTPAFPYRFEWKKADRFFRFAQNLKHYKGKWAGEPILLSDFQKFRLGSIFGWVHTRTGLRRFRTAYNEIPRKNGKSLEAAVVLLYVTFYDGEPGAEGYTIATKRDQAKLVFNDAKKLVQSSGLRSRINVMMTNLHRNETSSKAEPLGADHDSTDGLNPNIYVVDEMHAYKDRGLIDVMETATSAREQPLGFQITTAGFNPDSPCGVQHKYACDILDNLIVDETFFAVICHADLDDDWTLEATWKKANPHYGISINPEDLRALATKATNMPSAAATFKQKHLNLWVNASAPWLSLDGWRKGQHTDWTPADLKHEPCWVGIDLASKLDLTALVFVFPPVVGRASWRLLRWVWTPEDTIVDRAHRDQAPYGVWRDQGHLLTTPGTNVNHNVIRDVLIAARDEYDIEKIGFDPWHADKLKDDLITVDGFAKDQVLDVAQTYQGMSSAALRFEALVLEGLVDAGNCPLMAWCASNAVVQRDGKDNIFPVKKKSRGRIDPIMAAIMGLSLALREPVARQVETLGEFFG